MDQQPNFNPGNSVLETALTAAGEVRRLQDRIHTLQQRMENGEIISEDELTAYGDMLDRFHRMEGYSVESRAMKILDGLGLDEEIFEREVSLLSGGQKNRLALAMSLLPEPELLFLDEPTNHLDLSGIEFLENLLLEINSTLVVISHDRAFLDRISNRTIEVRRGHVRSFSGNYSAFRDWAVMEEETLARARENYDRKVEQTEDFIRKNIYGQKTKQAQSRRKMLERLEPPPDRGTKLKTPKWNLQAANRSGSMVIEARGLEMSFEETGPLFHDLDLLVHRGDKLAIIGDNGTGKSTLLRILGVKMNPDDGTVIWGKDVNPVYLEQIIERKEVPETMRVLDYMSAQAPDMTIGELRGWLGRFLFSGEDVDKNVKNLSEGEFKRLILAGLFRSDANLLLLDEPTNHLDIYSREALQRALEDFDGTCIMITHDREILSAVADKILEFNDISRSDKSFQAKVVEYPGDYSYYKFRRAEQAKLASEYVKREPDGKAKSRSNDALEDNKPRELSKNELRKIRERRDTLESKIAEMEERKSAVEHELADPETYEKENRAAELVAELKELSAAIEQSYAEWEELLEHD